MDWASFYALLFFLLPIVLGFYHRNPTLKKSCSPNTPHNSWQYSRFHPYILPRIDKAIHDRSSLLANSRWEPPKPTDGLTSDKLEYDSMSYTVEIPKAAGISWGSDLSFRFVYVQDLDEEGAAAATGLIKVGDYIIGCGDTNVVGLDFNTVLSVLADQPKVFNCTFFRGSKEQMVGAPAPDPSDITVNVRVIEKGKPDRILQCPGGTNLRTLLVGNGINVYRSLTRWTNCSGKQRCGTCIVETKKGAENCSRRGLDEDMVLQENADSYRLSCVTSVYGNVTVEVLGPVGAAQWTR